MRSTRIAVVLSACLTIVAARMLAAQSAGHPTLTVLGQQEAVGPNVRAVVYINRDRVPEVVIVVPRASVTPEDLKVAFHAMDKMRKHLKKNSKDLPPGGMLRSEIRKRPGRVRLSDAERAAYRYYITSFARAREVDVPGVGKGAAVEVTMPDWK